MLSEQRLTRRSFLKFAVKSTALACLAGTGSYAYATGVEPGWLQVTFHTLKLPRLDAQFHGYKVAHITDIHLGDWTTSDHLDEVVAAVNACQPDLVAITGDFFTRNPQAHGQELIRGLRKLRAKDGVVAVLGNHDHWHGPEVVRELLREGGVVEVSNGVRTLQRGSASLHVAGVDDVWMGAHRLEQVLDRLPPQGAAILLAHEPDFADTSAATGRFDLQLSGHSHGGQVVAPLLGPLRLPPLGQKYPSGLYRVGDMLQYTSRGVGMVRPHVRFNCRPEVAVFTLVAE